MISIQKMFLFIHIPKTGGNSIQHFLRDYSEDEIVVKANQEKVERFGVDNKKYNTNKHSTLSHYKSVLNPQIYRALFKFAVIRNPWDRMISYYFSPHRGVTEWNRDDFLRLVNRLPTSRHYICETSFLRKALQKLGVHTKIDHDIDFLIRFEHLSDDFKLVCEKLDIPYSPLPKINSSNRKHYAHYYDNVLKEVVRKKFCDEIRHGNYHFENA